MKYAVFFLSAAFGLSLFNLHQPARADNDSSPDAVQRDRDYDTADLSDDPYAGRAGYSFDGKILRVDSRHDRMTIVSDSDRYYRVDTYNSAILLSRRREGDASDLSSGMSVHVSGTLLGRNLIEADTVRVLTAADPVAESPVRPAEYAAPVKSAFLVDGIISKVDTDAQRMALLTDDDHRYTVDMQSADIILRSADRAGTIGDLSHGMRVHLIGTLLSGDIVQADRIRVLPNVETLPPLPVAAPPAVESLDSYTGILIDARNLPGIMRSPSPAIYGPDPDEALLYPDRSHVPTPDEVQEESIVRYYRTEDAARDGVGGAHPLILSAETVIGPAHDGVVLSAENAALFQALDKRLHYTRNWKVGFLIPADQ